MGDLKNVLKKKVVTGRPVLKGNSTSFTHLSMLTELREH